MTPRELAEVLSKRVQKARLDRIGEPMPQNAMPFSALPGPEQETWLDIAEAALAELRPASVGWSACNVMVITAEDFETLERELQEELWAVHDRGAEVVSASVESTGIRAYAFIVTRGRV